MASLLKPIECNQCQCKNVHKEKSPERWVCDDCDNIICSRLERIHNSDTCIKCGKYRNEVSFRNGKNICAECHAKYNKNYVIKNQDKLNKYKRKYYAENKEILRVKANAYWQSSPETYLSDLFHRINTNFGKKREVTITRNDLYELWRTQNGKCALTDLQMDHQWGLLTSASIDRINSSVGYIKENIQLVCKGINMLKNTHTQEETKEFIKMIKNISQ